MLEYLVVEKGGAVKDFAAWTMLLLRQLLLPPARLVRLVHPHPIIHFYQSQARKKGLSVLRSILIDAISIIQWLELPLPIFWQTSFRRLTAHRTRLARSVLVVYLLHNFFLLLRFIGLLDDIFAGFRDLFRIARIDRWPHSFPINLDFLLNFNNIPAIFATGYRIRLETVARVLLYCVRGVVHGNHNMLIN